MDSGCGMAGTVVASFIRGLKFESSRRQFNRTHYYLLPIKKTKNGKEAGNGPILKRQIYMVKVLQGLLYTLLRSLGIVMSVRKLFQHPNL